MGQANTIPRRINGVEGAAGEVIISGGPGVLETWGAGLPPGAHEATHVKAGADDIDSALDARAIALTAQGEIVFHAAAANTLAALAVGAAGQALLSGGAGADVSWGAPAPAAHAATHLDGAADEIDAADLAGTGGAAGEIIESDGAALSYVEPDGRYDPKAHVLATTGPHTDTLPLTDLAAGVRGNIIHRGAANWAALGVGAAGQALLSGGAGADVSWGAPAPEAHEATHVKGGTDDIDAALDARAIALANQGEIVYHAAGANTLAALAVGVAGQALLSGGPAANVSWGDVVDGPGAIAAVEAAGLDLASSKNINVTSILAANNTWSGLTATFTAGEVLALGDVVHVLAADSEVYKADADLATTMPAIAIATGPTTDGNPFEFLLLGFMRFDTWGWTPGSLLYASITEGTMSHTAPVGPGDQVQTVGIAITATIILFNPNYVLVELT